ncbi:hypothetical protein [Metabacillus halosaccharovorans]|uniref:hypothetical protein n=1 Tax=Metabacillus halosaccharovorans TaxID=930124 RepID=UPI001C1F2ED9|nr:hypothetical protein [Metabacillus halosaccharovorans]MBU7592341.1 hypothetical protein [Metabacillus halosaccharovorans]
MNDKIMEVFAKSIIASLPREKRKLYQFIEGVEDSLAQQSKTKEQFLTLLKEQSPHHQAANHFQMTIDETVNLMQQIEDEINFKLEDKLRRYKWIDYTDQIFANNEGDKKYYLVTL